MSEADAGSELSWNLASAGRYQRGEGLEVVKRLRMVTLEFASVNGTSSSPFTLTQLHGMEVH